MVFSSITFLSFFLVVIFLLHICIPNMHVKNALLILASLLFYAVGEPVYVLLMIGSSLLNYLIGKWIGKAKTEERLKKAKGLLVMAVVVNIGLLVVFKYANFLIGILNAIPHVSITEVKIALPIGISFFTFQAMSYVIDVYRGDCDYQKNYFKVLLYISFFPQLIAGPIVKYRDIEEEISNRHQTVEDIEAGIRRFIVGLSKKVLISNALAQMVDQLMPSVDRLGVAAWLPAIGYTLQIYYDFSGYSDMAIGLGWMFGFHFKENFDHPYASLSIKEFWRRWHISLSTWFKEYVYIPLGGNRKGRMRTIINKYIVFFLTGLWHGANFTFIIWGLVHGTCSVLEENKKLSINKIPLKFVRYLITMFVVICAFVLFRADTVGQGFTMLAQMFGCHANAYGNALILAQFTPYTIFAFVSGLLFMFPWIDKIREKLLAKNRGSINVCTQVCSGVVLLTCLAWCMIQLASDSYNPFIYFRF